MIIIFFSGIIFVGALTVGILLFNGTSSTLDGTYQLMKKSDHNQRMDLKITGTYTVTGAQVLQTINLIDDVGCDISVDGVTFHPGLDIQQTDVSVVNLTKKYVPSYTRKSDGSLARVTFTSQ
jgi:hypothetical protein